MRFKVKQAWHVEILGVSPVEVMIDSIIFWGRWFMEFPSQKTDSESHVLKNGFHAPHLPLNLYARVCA